VYTTGVDKLISEIFRQKLQKSLICPQSHLRAYLELILGDLPYIRFGFKQLDSLGLPDDANCVLLFSSLIINLDSDLIQKFLEDYTTLS